MSTRITRSSSHSMSNGAIQESIQPKECKKRTVREITVRSEMNISQKTKNTIYSDSDDNLRDMIRNRGRKKHTEKVRDVTYVAEKSPTKKQVDMSIYDYIEDGEIAQPKEPNPVNEIDEMNNERKCTNCQASFENPLEMLRHSRSCQSPKKILPLEEIEKYFDSPNRNYCPICEKRIKTRNFRSVFIKHLLVHTSGLLHECNICKKKFRRRDHMRAHRRRHIVIAPIYEG